MSKQQSDAIKAIQSDPNGIYLMCYAQPCKPGYEQCASC